MARKREVLANEDISDLPTPSGRHPMSGEPFWDQNTVRGLLTSAPVADERELPTSTTGRDPIIHAVASLAAAISLLERTPNAKNAAASDKMFTQMLGDYRVALDNARAALASAPVAGEAQPLGYVAEWCSTNKHDGRISVCGRSRITTKHQAELTAKQWADKSPQWGPMRVTAVYAAPQAMVDGLSEAMAHLRTLAKSGATADQMRELASKAIDRVNKKVGANYVG